MSMTGDCLFCNIIAGTIPAEKIAESENFIAFLDLFPASKGHTLIVPKQHNTDLLDFPSHLGQELLEFSQRIGSGVLAGVGAEGFNFVLNNGPAANQVVFHAHFHIIPRREGDGKLHLANGEKQSGEQLVETGEKIRNALD